MPQHRMSFANYFQWWWWFGTNNNCLSFGVDGGVYNDCFFFKLFFYCSIEYRKWTEFMRRYSMNRLPDFYMILFHFFFSIYLRILTKLFIIIVGIIKKVARFFLFISFSIIWIAVDPRKFFLSPPTTTTSSTSLWWIYAHWIRWKWKKNFFFSPKLNWIFFLLLLPAHFFFVVKFLVIWYWAICLIHFLFDFSVLFFYLPVNQESIKNKKIVPREPPPSSSSSSCIIYRVVG